MEELKNYLLRELETMPKIVKRNLSRIKHERDVFFEIKNYLEKYLKNSYVRERLVIMHGLRGIGKTILIFQLYHFLVNQKKVPENNVIYLSMDRVVRFTLEDLTTSLTTYTEIFHGESIANLNEKIFLFIDEAHFDTDWKTAVKSFYDLTDNLFVLVTGSSVIGLETNADLARRGVELPLFPINFMEYERLKNSVIQKKGMGDKIESLIVKEDLSTIIDLNKSSSKFKKEVEETKKNFDIELENYLYTGGLTETLEMNNKLEIRNTIFSIIDKMLRIDIPEIKSLKTDTI